MADEGGETRQRVVLDTSVLINFLNVTRVDLLTGHPTFRFIITDHVRGEVQQPEQREALERALLLRLFEETTVNSVEELSIFGDLIKTEKLGIGECAALAAAIHRDLPIAIDDRAARTKARELRAFEKFLGTADIVVSLMKAGMLSVDVADGMKAAWETIFRFRLPFRSFNDIT